LLCLAGRIRSQIREVRSRSSLADAIHLRLRDSLLAPLQRILRPMIDALRWVRPAAVLLLAAVLAGCVRTQQPEPPGPPRGVLKISGEGPRVRVSVEIAETAEAKTRGLMGRTSLPENAGMVFLEEEPVLSGFWMKDTLIPLSIAFWDEEGRIFNILDMEPCLEDTCPTYEPGGAWVGAVEVNQGFFEEHGVEVGDRAELERLAAA
jgi:uncharacterized membrane protein (UPF0127 family)